MAILLAIGMLVVQIQPAASQETRVIREGGNFLIMKVERTIPFEGAAGELKEKDVLDLFSGKKEMVPVEGEYHRTHRFSFPFKPAQIKVVTNKRLVKLQDGKLKQTGVSPPVTELNTSWKYVLLPFFGMILLGIGNWWNNTRRYLFYGYYGFLLLSILIFWLLSGDLSDSYFAAGMVLIIINTMAATFCCCGFEPKWLMFVIIAAFFWFALHGLIAYFLAWADSGTYLNYIYLLLIAEALGAVIAEGLKYFAPRPVLAE